MRNGVSRDYENFVAAINQQLQEQARSEDVKVALLGESERRRVKDESSSTTALVSKQLKKTQRKQKKTIKCYECGDSNHKKPYCPKLKKDPGKNVKFNDQKASTDQASANQALGSCTFNESIFINMDYRFRCYLTYGEGQECIVRCRLYR